MIPKAVVLAAARVIQRIRGIREHEDATELEEESLHRQQYL